MRHLLSMLTLGCLTLAAFAGDLDRTKPPQPGPAPEFKMGKIHQFTADNGLKVYVVERHKTPMVSINLVLDVDPVLEGDAVGYVDTAGLMLSRGTQTRDKLALDTAIDAIGASIATTAEGMTGTSLSKYKGQLMALMADMLINSNFTQDELDKILTQRKSAIQQAASDPGTIAQRVRAAVYFGDQHPYGEVETLATLDNVTLDKVKSYYQTYFRPNVSHLAIVGDVTLKEAKKLVKTYLSEWQKGEVPSHSYETPKAPSKPMVAVVDRPGAVQTVLSLGHPVDLKPGPPHAITASLATGILGGAGGRLYDNLREDKGYTYGAYARTQPDSLIGSFTGFAQVRTEVTKEAAQEFLNEYNRIRNEGVTADEVETRVSMITGTYAQTLEDPETLGTFAIDTNRYGLPQDYYANYLKYLAQQTPETVKTFVNDFIKPENLIILAVGNGDEIKTALDGFGEMVLFDADGKKIDPNAVSIPEGMTASTVIEKYLKAVGGVEAIKNLKDLELTGKMQVPGMPLDFNLKYKAPNMNMTVALMNGQPVFKKVFDGSAGYMEQMGNRKPMSEEEVTDEKIESQLIPEMVFAEAGVKSELVGAEMIDGKQAYKLKVTYPSGEDRYAYFDAESGLKVRSLGTQQSQQGEVTVTLTFDDYREVEGVMVPFKMNQSMGPMNMSIEFNKVEANKGLDEATFKAGS